MKRNILFLLLLIPLLTGLLFFILFNPLNEIPSKGTDTHKTLIQNEHIRPVPAFDRGPALEELNNSIGSWEGRFIAGRRDISISSSPTVTHQLINHFRKPTETFVITVGHGFQITTPKGARFDFPDAAFVDKNGSKVTGKVTIRISEYHSITEMVLADLTTQCGDKPLVSAGMYHLVAEQDGADLQLAHDKRYTLTLPTNRMEEGMQLFYGNDSGPNNIINWSSSEGANDVQLSMLGTTAENWLASRRLAQCFECSRSIHKHMEWPRGVSVGNGPHWVVLSVRLDYTGQVLGTRKVKGFHPAYDKAVAQAVQKMDTWIPARAKKDQPVDVFMPVILIRDGIWKAMALKAYESGDQLYQEYQRVLTNESVPLDWDSIGTDTMSGFSGTAVGEYVFSSAQLGWLNIDRFMKLPIEKQSTILAKATTKPQPDESVRVIMINEMSLIAAKPDQYGTFKRDHLPRGQDVIVFGSRTTAGIPEFAIQRVTLDDVMKTVSLEYQPVRFSDVPELIEQLRSKPNT